LLQQQLQDDGSARRLGIEPQECTQLAAESATELAILQGALGQ
jgi:hypothetical protein